ncbi:MAG: CdvA-like protein [Nitrososphaerota archaeon]|nr:CdvA-like protein [Nitrososphaerota archaeon]MDG6966418.1 CdvA-like protein [Nitrososphaerota archaeon]MDG6979110.1 CdvA-like protein [Nitrososphaerota archaeon]MDG7020559.1 CdvA-like protein [Nitrososphaerota archaeon]MDG7022084.1 CdvA-like protein [Nitrososphaerota archaeon]
MVAEGSGWVGKVVRDIYGRELGRAVGVVFDLGGDVASIGVDRAGSFVEISPEIVVSDRDELEVMPEWKAEAGRAGIAGASLERRLAALEGMVERKEIPQDAYAALHSRLAAVRGTHDQLAARILARLDDLEREDESIDLFLSMVRVQFLAGEMGEESFRLTEEYCKAMKAANAREGEDIRKAVEEPQLGRASDVVLSRDARKEGGAPEAAPGPPATERP